MYTVAFITPVPPTVTLPPSGIGADAVAVLSVITSATTESSGFKNATARPATGTPPS